MTSGDVPSDVRAALVRGREAVDDWWARGVELDDPPDEEFLTRILLESADPEVRHVRFNRPQESEIGADWLWWFVDESKECFGLLVQAKVLKRHRRGWHVDVAYRDGRQTRRLLDAADLFEVPAAYVLYTGDVRQRADLSCGWNHVDDGCDRCARSGVSILAALVADSYAGMGYGGEEIYVAACPLEDLAISDPEPVWDQHRDHVSDEVRRFLLGPQIGARGVARELFRQVFRHRGLEHGMVRDEVLEVASGPGFVFSGPLPADQGHMARPYFPHVLNGLRPALPADIAALFAGVPADDDAFPALAGVVLVQR